MGFGGGSEPPAAQTVTQKNTVQLSPQQQQMYKLLLPQIKDVFKTGYELPDNLVPGFDPLQTEAQNKLVGSASAGGDLSNFTGELGQAHKFLLGDVLDPSSNPALQGYMDRGKRQLDEGFSETVLPGIRNEAVTSGSLGGSRQGVAEGLASGRYLSSVEESGSNILNNAYNSGLDAMVKGVGLGPQTQNALNMPSFALDAVGNARRNLELEKIGGEITKSNTDYNTVQDFLAMINGMPGASGTSQVTGPGTTKPSPIMSGLGGASAGLGLAGALTTAGFAVNPLVGLALGGLVGVLGN